MPLQYDPQHWRERPAQMRALAFETTEAEIAAMMFQVADDYDRLAITPKGAG